MASILIFAILLNFLLLPKTLGWPDGAPCIHAAYESMNPLEAVEHQGGLQLTEPPFQIELDRKCYWLNQPIGLQLKGNTTKTKFKGFQIQPIVWKGSKFGQRIGNFVRLDDNGSWQFQCFRKKDSITHSHDEPKIQMKMWWKNNDDDTQYVQFVATVVVNLKKFWVKSVVSPPLPPCKVEREIGPWAKPIPREPPPVNQFKMDTWRIFNHESSGTFPRSIADFNQEDGSFKAAPRFNEKPFVPITRPTFAPPTPAPAPVFVTVAGSFQNSGIREISGDVSINRQPILPPQTRPPPPPPTTQPPIQIIPSQTSRPVFQVQPQRPQPQPQQPQPQTRQRLTHIIPLPNMEMNRRTPNPVPSFSQPAISNPTLVTIAPTRMIASQQQQQFQQQQQSQLQRMMQLNRQIEMRRQQQIQQQRLQQQQQQPQPQPFQQRGQGQFCVDRDPPGRCFGWLSYCGHSRYMEINCRRTCRFC